MNEADSRFECRRLQVGNGSRWGYGVIAVTPDSRALCIVTPSVAQWTDGWDSRICARLDGVIKQVEGLSGRIAEHNHQISALEKLLKPVHTRNPQLACAVCQAPRFRH